VESKQEAKKPRSQEDEWLVARVRARRLVGMRSRASGVAFPETVPALMLMPAFLYVLFIVLWTRDAGRAGAHPYHPTAPATRPLIDQRDADGVHMLLLQAPRPVVSPSFAFASPFFAIALKVFD